ncbi:hypothetical protein Chor_002509 [Crotalus horridus]
MIKDGVRTELKTLLRTEQVDVREEGSGTCRFSYSDPDIIVSYSKNNSEDWIQLEKIRAPSNVSTIIHILYLPEEAKGENIQFQWKQEYVRVGDVYESCWALDNILIINAAHRQIVLEDALDPVDTGNWLFFPGATIKHSCQSDGNAIYFHGTEGNEFNFATTRDVDLSTEDAQEQWAEEFESQPKGWDISGAIIGTECGTLESGSSAVFLREGERKLCTPYMDMTGYGNLRFYFSMGGSCDTGESHENDVLLYAKMEGRKDHITLDVMTYASHRIPSLVSVVISPELQTPATKFCLKQKNHQGPNKNVWAIDYFHVLPVLPATVTHMVQFSINLGSLVWNSPPTTVAPGPYFTPNVCRRRVLDPTLLTARSMRLKITVGVTLAFRGLHVRWLLKLFPCLSRKASALPDSLPITTFTLSVVLKSVSAAEFWRVAKL